MRALFNPGRVVITPAAQEFLERAQVAPHAFLLRHLAGDWGDLDAEDTAMNDAALLDGNLRIFSSYVVGHYLRIYVVTEADRSVTTILLPEDY